MTPINKKEYQTFLKESDTLIRSYDFEIQKTERGYRLFTSLGILNINFWESSICYTTFMRFESLELDDFKRVFPNERINRFSFKWNIHEEDKSENFKILTQRLDTLSLL